MHGGKVLSVQLTLHDALKLLQKAVKELDEAIAYHPPSDPKMIEQDMRRRGWYVEPEHKRGPA